MKMSFFGSGRRLGSILWTARKGRLLHRCSIGTLNVCQMYPLQSFPSIRQFSVSENSDEVTTGAAQSETKEREPQGKKNRRHVKVERKLHSRVFSQTELAENEEFIRSIQSALEEHDRFGNLQEWENKKNEFVPWEKTRHQASCRIPLTQKTRGERNTSAVSGQEAGLFPARRNSWRNTFGTLQQDDLDDRIQESQTTTVGSHEERFSYDEEEDRKHIRLSTVNRRHIPEWYGRKILKLGKTGQVREAVKVFDEWMLKEDRVMPNSYVFTCLITVLGRAGYTQKAFSVFNKMKKMGITPKPATYTALFNACANSPWKQDGRARADNLYRLMKEQGVEPTFITGKAMIKAFALCGELRPAFSLVDELSRVYLPDPEVFSFLLMACISDKEAGLRHAIQVWRLMRKMNVQPDLPLYNLLIRCVRDCGVGDIPSLTLLLSGDVAPPARTKDGKRKLSQKISSSSSSSSNCVSGGEGHVLMLKTLPHQQAKKDDGPGEISSPSANQFSIHADSEKTDCTADDMSCLNTTQSSMHGKDVLFNTEERDKVLDGMPSPGTVQSSVDADYVLSDSWETDNILEGMPSPTETEEYLHAKVFTTSENQHWYTETGVEETAFPSKIADEETNLMQVNNKNIPSPTASPLPTIPDVLSPKCDASQLISLGDLSTKEARLSLLGGTDGVLHRMGEDGAAPNIVTFTQLASVAEPTVAVEEQLMERMREWKVKPDIDFVNTLIHKRCMRGDFAAARDAANLMEKHDLTANQRSYGVLAMACRSVKDASRLLEAMEKADMAPNIEIMGSLMYSASLNFSHKLWVLRQVQRLDLQPNDKFLCNVEFGLHLARRRILEAEKKDNHDSYFLSPKFQASLETFVQQYEAWLKQTRVETPPHPWAVFKPVPADQNTASLGV